MVTSTGPEEVAVATKTRGHTRRRAPPQRCSLWWRRCSTYTSAFIRMTTGLSSLALSATASPLALAPMYRGFTLLRLPSTASAF